MLPSITSLLCPRMQKALSLLPFPLTFLPSLREPLILCMRQFPQGLCRSFPRPDFCIFPWLPSTMLPSCRERTGWCIRYCAQLPPARLSGRWHKRTRNGREGCCWMRQPTKKPFHPGPKPCLEPRKLLLHVHLTLFRGSSFFPSILSQAPLQRLSCEKGCSGERSNAMANYPMESWVASSTSWTLSTGKGLPPIFWSCTTSYR